MAAADSQHRLTWIRTKQWYLASVSRHPLLQPGCHPLLQPVVRCCSLGVIRCYSLDGIKRARASELHKAESVLRDFLEKAGLPHTPNVALKGKARGKIPARYLLVYSFGDEMYRRAWLGLSRGSTALKAEETDTGSHLCQWRG